MSDTNSTAYRDLEIALDRDIEEWLREHPDVEDPHETDFTDWLIDDEVTALMPVYHSEILACACDNFDLATTAPEIYLEDPTPLQLIVANLEAALREHGYQYFQDAVYERNDGRVRCAWCDSWVSCEASLEDDEGNSYCSGRCFTKDHPDEPDQDTTGCDEEEAIRDEPDERPYWDF